MDNLSSIKKVGEQLDLIRQLSKDGKEDQAACVAQSLFENYAFSRDACLRQEEELLNARNFLAESEDRSRKLEQRLKDTIESYNADFQLFRKFCNAQNYVSSLSSVDDLPRVIEKISAELEASRISVVLDRDLCSGLPCGGVSTFYLKGCMRYIDATLSKDENRVYIGPISRMMRPDIFFGDSEMSPEKGGSCFSFGLMNKYKPDEIIGLFSIYDPSVTRFHPEMGTDFLEHFCNSVASTLIDVIDHQRADLLREDVERITRHDLKTPLNAVINLPHLLLGSEEDPGRIEMIKSIQDAGYKMLGLINRSYDIYRMESGTYELNSVKVDVVQQLARIRLDLLNLLESKQSELRIIINDKPSEGGFFLVRGEELLIFSMLANLVKNAIEASPSASPVTVGLSDVNELTLSVHNAGLVPDEVRDVFFDKYTTCGKPGGTGLGTYSARLIAHAHGGEIMMDSTQENGTTIMVLFPEECKP